MLLLAIVFNVAYSFHPRVFGLSSSRIAAKSIQSPLFMSETKEEEGLDLDLEQMFEG